MDNDTLALMKGFTEKYPPKDKDVLEVGSLNVNGSYRAFFQDARSYTGIDIVEGRDVDYVLQEPYKYPFEKEEFDVVICGQTLEHMEHPWRGFAEMVRVLKTGGLVCVTVPWQWAIHRYPLDCWRVLPDGMEVLAKDNNIKAIQNITHKNHTFFIGEK